MAKLTRMQKYSDYREQMASDSEATTVSEDLNKFQNELNKVKAYTTTAEVEAILSGDGENSGKTQAEVSAEVISELTAEKETDSDSDSVLKALDEIINGVSLNDDISNDIFEEIPAEVQVISADSMADELENTAVETEENYRDEINSIIDELMGITDFAVPEITASLFDANESDDVAYDNEEKIDVEATIEETAYSETTVLEDNVAEPEVVDQDVVCEIIGAEPEQNNSEVEIHCVPFDVPTVKKTDKTDSQIYGQICSCSDDLANVVDSEREFYGVAAPVMWVAPVIEDNADETNEVIVEAEPLSIDDVISGLFESANKDEESDVASVTIEEAIDIAAEEIEKEDKDLTVADSFDEKQVESIHCVSFEMPAVKKNDKSDSQINEQIDNCVSDFEMTIDAERIILGIPAPVLKSDTPAHSEADLSAMAEVANNDSNVDEIFSMFDSIEEELNKSASDNDEISIADIVIPEEITSPVSENEDSEIKATSEIKDETTDEIAENYDDNDCSLDTEEKMTSDSDDFIPEIPIPEELIASDDDDITLTNEISINYISDALNEAESFSAKEGLKTVEDITATIIREVDHSDESFDHPVAVATAPGDTEVVEIKNFAELAEEDREAVLDDTIPFVIDKKMKKEEESSNDEEDDFIPNRILNIVLIVLIAVLLLVLGVVIYYIFLAQGVL